MWETWGFPVHDAIRKPGKALDGVPPILSKQWTQLRTLYPMFLKPELFDSGHLHELYHLLQQHFSDFTEEEKAGTIEAIRQIAAPKAIERNVPSYDYQDRLKSLLLKLAEKGQDVILYAERLRHLGMQDVFGRLTPR
jgi:hypothetical protein